MDEEEQFHNIDTRKPWKSTGKFIENLLKSNREVVPKIWQLKLIVRTFIKKFDLTTDSNNIYSKTSFLVQIKFITEDLEQTHIQILILN